MFILLMVSSILNHLSDIKKFFIYDRVLRSLAVRADLRASELDFGMIGIIVYTNITRSHVSSDGDVALSHWIFLTLHSPFHLLIFSRPCRRFI